MQYIHYWPQFYLFAIFPATTLQPMKIIIFWIFLSKYPRKPTCYWQCNCSSVCRKWGDMPLIFYSSYTPIMAVIKSYSSTFSPEFGKPIRWSETRLYYGWVFLNKIVMQIVNTCCCYRWLTNSPISMRVTNILLLKISMVSLGHSCDSTIWTVNIFKT